MEALGYSLSWKTKCFINGGCGSTVYAHTNGYGDFVLFNRLEPPWLVHDCYFDRFGVGGRVNISGSRDMPYNGIPSREWEAVTPITPNANGPRKRYGFIGTVTNVEKGFVGRSEEFRNLPRAAEEEVRRTLIGRRSLVTIVSGDGAEFTAFIDLDKAPVRFQHIVAVDLKAVRLLNTSVFVVTQVEPFGGD